MVVGHRIDDQVEPPCRAAMSPASAEMTM
jgi:hypothetical protein